MGRSKKKPTKMVSLKFRRGGRKEPRTVSPERSTRDASTMTEDSQSLKLKKEEEGGSEKNKEPGTVISSQESSKKETKLEVSPSPTTELQSERGNKQASISSQESSKKLTKSEVSPLPTTELQSERGRKREKGNQQASISSQSSKKETKSEVSPLPTTELQSVRGRKRDKGNKQASISSQESSKKPAKSEVSPSPTKELGSEKAKQGAVSISSECKKLGYSEGSQSSTELKREEAQGSGKDLENNMYEFVTNMVQRFRYEIALENIVKYEAVETKTIPEKQKTKYIFKKVTNVCPHPVVIFGTNKEPGFSVRTPKMKAPAHVLTGNDVELYTQYFFVKDTLPIPTMHLKKDWISDPDLSEVYLQTNKSCCQDHALKMVGITSWCLKQNLIRANDIYWFFADANEKWVKIFNLTCVFEMYPKYEDDVVVEYKKSSQNKKRDVIQVKAVAILLFHIAKFFWKLPNSSRHNLRIRNLLRRCVGLVNRFNYPQIYIKARFMLSSICIPLDTNPSDPRFRNEALTASTAPTSSEEEENRDDTEPLSTNIHEQLSSASHHAFEGLLMITLLRTNDPQKIKVTPKPKKATKDPLVAVELPLTESVEPQNIESINRNLEASDAGSPSVEDNQNLEVSDGGNQSVDDRNSEVADVGSQSVEDNRNSEVSDAGTSMEDTLNSEVSDAGSPSVEDTLNSEESDAGSPSEEDYLNSEVSDAGSPSVEDTLNSEESDAGSPSEEDYLNSEVSDAGSPSVEDTLNSEESDAGSPSVEDNRNSEVSDAGSPSVEDTLNSEESDAGSPSVEDTLNSEESDAGSPSEEDDLNSEVSDAGSPSVEDNRNAEVFDAGSQFVEDVNSRTVREKTLNPLSAAKKTLGDKVLTSTPNKEVETFQAFSNINAKVKRELDFDSRNEAAKFESEGTEGIKGGELRSSVERSKICTRDKGAQSTPSNIEGESQLSRSTPGEIEDGARRESLSSIPIIRTDQLFEINLDETSEIIVTNIGLTNPANEENPVHIDYETITRDERYNVTDPVMQDLYLSDDSEYINETIDLEMNYINMNNTVEDALNPRESLYTRDSWSDDENAHADLFSPVSCSSSISEKPDDEFVDTISSEMIPREVWDNLSWKWKIVYKLLKKVFLVYTIRARVEKYREQYLVSLKYVEVALHAWWTVCLILGFDNLKCSVPYMVAADVYNSLFEVKFCENRELFNADWHLPLANRLQSILTYFSGTRDSTWTMGVPKDPYHNLRLAYTSYKLGSKVDDPRSSSRVRYKFMRFCMHLIKAFLDMIEVEENFENYRLVVTWQFFTKVMADVQDLRNQFQVKDVLTKTDKVKIDAQIGRFKSLYGLSRVKSGEFNYLDEKTISYFLGSIVSYEEGLKLTPPLQRKTIETAKTLVWGYACTCHKFFSVTEKFYWMQERARVLPKVKLMKPIVVKCMMVARMRYSENKAWQVMAQDICRRFGAILYNEYRLTGHVEMLVLAEEYFRGASKLLIKLNANPVTIVSNCVTHLSVLHVMHILTQDVIDKWELCLAMFSRLVSSSNAAVSMMSPEFIYENDPQIRRRNAAVDPMEKAIVDFMDVERAKVSRHYQGEIAKFKYIMRVAGARLKDMTSLIRFNRFKRTVADLNDCLLNENASNTLIAVKKKFPILLRKWNKKKHPSRCTSE